MADTKPQVQKLKRTLSRVNTEKTLHLGILYLMISVINI